MTQHTTPAPHALARLGVIVVAAGQGLRLGAGVPKAFTSIGGRTLLEHALRTVLALPGGGQLVLVVPQDRAAESLDLVAESSAEELGWHVAVVAGGRERHESVRFGIEALLPTVDTVLVHDAARPLTPSELFMRVAAEVRRTGAAVVPGVPVADTLKRVTAEGLVQETVPRADLVAVQTPQGFPREMLEAAHLGLQERGGVPASDQTLADSALSNSSPAKGAPAEPSHVLLLPTDDAEVVQQVGGQVRIVAGELRAHKLTTASDGELLDALWRADTGAQAGDSEPAR